jgi:hypothetical protein
MSRSAGNGNEFADHTPGLVAFLDGDHQPRSLGADGSPKTAPSRIQRELVRCVSAASAGDPVDAAVGRLETSRALWATEVSPAALLVNKERNTKQRRQKSRR